MRYAAPYPHGNTSTFILDHSKSEQCRDELASHTICKEQRY